MHRVFRSTFVGLLALASLTACGDKVSGPEITTTTTGGGGGNVVHSVTVSPPSATLAKAGDKFTFGVSVDADAGVTDRTVTWTSGNTAVATVDANGTVTAVGAGTTSITAASKASPSVTGSASVTVAGGSGAPATVTVSTINQTVCGFGGCNSVPANLAAVAGQLDVTLNVDPGSANLIGVDLLLNCGGADTVVATTSLASGAAAPVAEAATAPVTLSFNTAAFDSLSGKARIRNGTCTLKGRARTSAGTTTSTGQQITMANADVIVGNITSTKRGLDAAGRLWNGGDVTITATPVFYSANRAAATTTITFEGKTQTVSNGTTGTVSATFTDGNGANAGGVTDIDGITDANAGATVTVSTVDANGQNLNQVAACGATVCTSQSVLAGNPAPAFPATTPFRLDTQKPLAGTFALANNAMQQTSANGYLSGSFRFVADSASGYVGPNAGAAAATGSNCPTTAATTPVTCNFDFGGSDRVKVTFQYRVTGASSSTYANVTSASSLNETTATTGNDNSYQLRMITADTLGNADTTTVGNFGVDKTAPSSFASTLTAGPSDMQQFTTLGSANAPGYTTSGITDNLSGPSIDPANGLPRALVAQTRNWSGLNPSSGTLAAIDGNVYSNTASANPVNGTFRMPNLAPGDQSPCMIGRFNTSASAAGANALEAYNRSGTLIGYCTPVFFDLIGGNAVPGSADITYTSGSTTGGYYKTEIITVDEAGNRTAPFTRTIVEDATAPSVSGVGLPGSIAGNSTVSFSGTGTDNVDLVGAYAVLSYTGAGMNLRYPTTAGPGTAFDNVLTRSATVTANVNNFIRTLAPATAGAPASSTTTANQAQTVDLRAIDEVGLKGGLAAPAALGSVSFGSQTSSSWDATNFNAGFALTGNNGNQVYNCPAPTTGQTTGCGPAGTTTPTNTSITLSATAAGTTATFNNPFSVVTFWYQNANGNWVQFASTSASTVSDNGTNRTWTYTTTFDPPATGPDGTSLTPAAGTDIALPVRAIGINSSGDAVTTATYTLTIKNS